MNSVQSPVTSNQLQGKRPLPEGWEWTTLGEIADLVGGGTPSREKPEYFTGKYVWLTPTEIPKNQIAIVSDSRERITDDALHHSSARLIPKGSVLMTSRASIGYVAVAGTEVTTNQGFASFLPKDGVNNFFLAYWLWANASFFIGQATGTTFKEITKSKLRTFSFPLPPLPEQERIVARLEELLSDLEAGAAALERVRAGVKRYKASVLKSACEGKLFGDKGIGEGELPEGWRWVTIEQVSENIVDCLHSTPKFTESGKYCVDTNWIEPGKFVFERARFVTKETYKDRVRRLVPQAGDILFSREGTIGTAVVVPEDLELCLGQRIMMFRPNDFITPEYMTWTLLSLVFQKQWKPKIIGTTSPHINIGDIRQMVLPLPPLEEQRRIVAEVEQRLESARAVESAVDVGLKRAARLRQAVLRSAFEGRLLTDSVTPKLRGQADSRTGAD